MAAIWTFAITQPLDLVASKFKYISILTTTIIVSTIDNFRRGNYSWFDNPATEYSCGTGQPTVIQIIIVDNFNRLDGILVVRESFVC